jgi:hypothetical protein
MNSEEARQIKTQTREIDEGEKLREGREVPGMKSNLGGAESFP